METLTTTTANTNVTFRFRAVSMLAGVVIAIICALVSLNKIQSGEESAKAQESIETPAFAKLNMLVNSASLVSNAVMPFTEK